MSNLMSLDFNLDSTSKPSPKQSVQLGCTTPATYQLDSHESSPHNNIKDMMLFLDMKCIASMFPGSTNFEKGLSTSKPKPHLWYSPLITRIKKFGIRY